MPLAQLSALIPDIVCLMLCLVAAVIDLRELRIPNRLTYGGTALGLLLGFSLAAMFQGVEKGVTVGLLPSLAGCFFLFIPFCALALAGMMGMGDAKLMAAVGALVRWPLCLPVLVYVLLAGGVLSIVHALLRGRMREVLGNIPRAARSLLGGRAAARDDPRLHQMPYGIAILIGTASAVLARHLPVFRFL